MVNDISIVGAGEQQGSIVAKSNNGEGMPMAGLRQSSSFLCNKEKIDLGIQKRNLEYKNGI